MQVKLLRAIQENTIRPVGSEKEIPVDVRILSASHKNLQQEVEDKNFREDLFYRLDVINLQVPPLRDRLSDVPILSNHILKNLSDSLGFGPVALSQNAMTTLCSYHFPGNIRELENILQRAITLTDSDAIGAEDLNLKPSPKLDERPTQSGMTEQEIKNKEGHSLPSGYTLEEYLESIEKEIITRTLEECRWNKTATAEQLGMSFRSIRYRLKKLGID